VQRHAEAIGPEAAAFSALWRVKQLEYSWVLSLIGRYTSFWSLTEQALDFTLARHPAVDPALRAPLLDAYRVLDAYPEVPAMLARLRAKGLRTAIFSNGNQAMVDRAVASAGLGDRLDAVISVEDAQIFKTAPKSYRIVLDRLGVDEADVIFCSSNRWDIAGASAFGFTPVWVNRQGQPDEYPDLPPAAVVSDLADLA
jgi:2-haloacid dehalogenase